MTQGNFVQVPNWVAKPGLHLEQEQEQELARLSAGCRLHFINVCSFAYGKRDECRPGLARLAREAMVTIRTIQRWNRQLQNVGLMTIRRRIKELATNVYTILQKAGIVQMACDPTITPDDHAVLATRSLEDDQVIALAHEEQKVEEEKGEEEPICAQSPLPLPVDIQARTPALMAMWKNNVLCAMGCELLGISRHGGVAYLRVPDASDPRIGKLMRFLYMRLRQWGAKRLVYGE